MSTELVPADQGVLAVLPDATGPEVFVSVSEAAADHLTAWEGNQQFRALHEAAHAVVAAVLGLRVRSVDIKARWESTTRVAFGEDDQEEAVRSSTDLARIVVMLAGPAAERLVLGEETSGGSRDLHDATRAAIERFEAGLDPDAIYVSCEAFLRPAESIMEARADSVVKTIAQARSRAEALVVEHRETILAFARRLLVARSLSGGELVAALREVGLEPVVDRS